MTEISKCKSCGYVGPWKACCGRMNLDAATADEAWQESRRQTLIEVDRLCRRQHDHGGGWLESGDDVWLFRLGAEACMNDVERLAKPEEGT